MQNIVTALLNMDVATPGQLTPAIQSIAQTLGVIMNIMLSEDDSSAAVPTTTSSVNDTNTTTETTESVSATSEDPCLALSPIDKINADKPGVVEYETDIGDSGRIGCVQEIYFISNLLVEMKINVDPSKQRCEGIVSATGAAGADVGGKVMDILNHLTELLLSKSVVGEEHEIDTKNIKIFAKMASGENAKKPFNILDTGVSVDLPDHFCLEKPEDKKCNAPVGISAIVYINNPRVSTRIKQTQKKVF